MCEKNATHKRCLDLVGQRFGRLVVLQRVNDKIDPKTGKHKTKFLCQCDCGNQKVVLGSALTQGTIRSCGCLHQNLQRSLAAYSWVYESLYRQPCNSGFVPDYTPG